jgi:hypothetical protein
MSDEPSAASLEYDAVGQYDQSDEASTPSSSPLASPILVGSCSPMRLAGEPDNSDKNATGDDIGDDVSDHPPSMSLDLSEFKGQSVEEEQSDGKTIYSPILFRIGSPMRPAGAPDCADKNATGDDFELPSLSLDLCQFDDDTIQNQEKHNAPSHITAQQKRSAGDDTSPEPKKKRRGTQPPKTRPDFASCECTITQNGVATPAYRKTMPGKGECLPLSLLVHLVGEKVIHLLHAVNIEEFLESHSPILNRRSLKE